MAARTRLGALLTVTACWLCVSCAGPRQAGWRLEAPGTPATGAPHTALAGASAPYHGEPPDASMTATEPGDPTRVPQQLGLRTALLLALEANKDIRVSSLTADADEYRISRAKGQFDATLFGEATRGRDNSPVADVPLDRNDFAEGSARTGVRKRFITGTNVELAASTDYLRDTDNGSALNPSYDTAVTVSLSQDLLRDFGVGVNRTDIVVAQNNWRISTEGLRNQVMETLFEVESAYWDLYFAHRDLAVRRQQLKRAERLVEQAEAYAEVGTSPPLDITRAQSSAARQRVSIHQAQNQLQRLRHRLLRLLGVADAEQSGAEFELVDDPAAAPLALTLPEALKVALENRPEYRQALLRIGNADLQQQFAANQRLPSLEVFGEYDFAGLGEEFSSSTDVLDDGDHGSWLFGLRFEWPFPNRAATSDYRIAGLERDIAGARLAAVEETITREVADALSDLRAADGRLESARRARELAEKLLQAEEKSFSLGRSNSLDVLNAQESVAVAERDEVRARTDYATAVANLLRAEGILLQARGVALRGDNRR